MSRRSSPMTSQEVNAAIRESLGLPPKPEPQPTVPQEGHICDFPIWSYSKKRSTITKLTITYEDGTYFQLEAPKGLPGVSSPGYLERIRISFFENPLFCPSLQGKTRGRERRMKVHNRLDLGARTWYRHALWPPQGSGSTKTPSSRSSAITGGPSSSAIHATRIAMYRPSSTKCLAVARQSRATAHICAYIAWKRNGWPSVARVASASPAAKCTWMSGWLTSVARSTKVYRIVTWC